MIKAEDLRIGDLVRVSCDCEFPKGAVCAVSEIRTLKLSEGAVDLVRLIPSSGNDEWQELWCYNIEGIPLTPEILKKNDFNTMVPERCYTQSMGDTSRVLKRYISIERRDSGWAVFLKYDSLPDHVLIRKIQYVHELQNILWALGLNADLKI